MLQSVIFIIIVCLIVYVLFLQGKEKNEGKENFESDPASDILTKYAGDLENLSPEDLKERVATLRASLAKFGLYPNGDSPDLSKYVLKSQMNPGDGKCVVAVADDRDKYIAKASVPEPQCPGVDMSKYILKSSIQPEKICPPQQEVDYSKYVLKTTIPPAQKCPACICPKVKVSAGLCKECPPQEKPVCPEVKPCPTATCPAPKPCPVPDKAPTCSEVKYVNVPVVLKKTVTVNDKGEIIDTQESQHSRHGGQGGQDGYNNSDSNGRDGRDGRDGRNGYNEHNNGYNNGTTGSRYPAASNSDEDELDHTTFTMPKQRNSELLNNSNRAYKGFNNIVAFNPYGQTIPLSDRISSTLAQQNDASIQDDVKGSALLKVLDNQNEINVRGMDMSLKKTIPGTNLLANQSNNKTAPVKYSDVMRKY